MFGQSGPAGKPKPRAETIRYSQSGIGVGPIGGIEVDQGGESTARSEFKNDAVIRGTAIVGCAVKVAVAGLNESSPGMSPIGGIKADQSGQRSTGGEFKYGAIV